MFKRAGARVVGVVMNRIPRNRGYYYGGYKYYSAYGDHKRYFGKETQPTIRPKSEQGEAHPDTIPVAAPEMETPAATLLQVEVSPVRSYLGGLFEKLRELPPADPDHH